MVVTTIILRFRLDIRTPLSWIDSVAMMSGGSLYLKRGTVDEAEVVVLRLLLLFEMDQSWIRAHHWHVISAEIAFENGFRQPLYQIRKYQEISLLIVNCGWSTVHVSWLEWRAADLQSDFNCQQSTKESLGDKSSLKGNMLDSCDCRILNKSSIAVLCFTWNIQFDIDVHLNFFVRNRYRLQFNKQQTRSSKRSDETHWPNNTIMLLHSLINNGSYAFQ